jgi:APA family basic amino acid/polyamine antiporter
MTTFRRALGPFDATMVVIGGIIGSGIFINPYLVAQRLGSAPLVLAAWAAGGAIALAGAFAYAELGAARAHRKRRHRGGGDYLRHLRPAADGTTGHRACSAGDRGGRGAVSRQLPGRQAGHRVLNVLVVLKVAALAALTGFGAFAPAHEGWWTAAKEPSRSPLTAAVAFGAALVPILFAYGGWQNANYVAEEIENPERNLPVSLIAGTTAVVVVYVLVNIVYLRALGLEGLAATTTPASDAAGRMFGPFGDRFVTAAIAISTFGFLDLAILAPTRVYYAMAADGVFLPSLAKLHPRYHTPGLAIVLQSAWSCLLALSGTYGQLLDYVVFADWIFFGLTVSTVIVFRRTFPVDRRAPGAFRAPGYPIVQIAFATVSAAIVLSVVWADPAGALRGALLLAAGVPVYYWFTSRPS